MKQYISFIITTLAILLFNACNTDLENVTAQKVKDIESLQVDNTNEFVCTADNGQEVAYTLTWEEGGFGENISITYYVQIDLQGNNFENPVEIIVGTNLKKKELISSELNSAMHTLRQPIDKATLLETRIIGKPMVLGSSQPVLPEVLSNTNIVLTVSSFAMEASHMVGDMFVGEWTEPGFWDINNYKNVMFRDDILGSDLYISNFRANGSFKIVQNSRLGDWSVTYGKSGAGTLSTSGGNISDITDVGYYKVVVNMAELTYSITPFDASGAKEYTRIILSGSAINGEIELTQTTYDKHMWEVDNVELKNGTLVFKSEDTTWSSDAFPYGLSEENGGENIPVTEGKYYIRFSDLSKNYIFYNKEAKKK